MAQTGQQ